jgi:hypothetical protein
MKHFLRKLYSLQTALFFLVIICFISSCGTTSKITSTLTPEQQNVRIMNGDQTTTLDLMNTHISVATEQLISEYAARVRAVQLKADVAQLIVYYYGGAGNPYTYRFWKRK